MKIGIDSRIVTDKSSGVVTYIINLIRELSNFKDLDLYLFCQKKYSNILNPKNKKNIHFVFADYDNDLYWENFLINQNEFGEKINGQKLDLFHSPIGFGVPQNVTTKLVLTVHDLIALSNTDPISKKQKEQYVSSLTASVNKADRIVSISKFTQEELKDKFQQIDKKRLSVTYNGFDKLENYHDLSKTFSLLAKEMNIKKNKYISYVGSATPRKNLLNLVYGFAYYCKKIKNSEIKLVLVSKFDRSLTIITLNKIKKVITASNLRNKIIFSTRYINDREKSVIIKNSLVFIYPSLYEGFGLPILEAMSLKIPVICSDIPVFKEIYRGNVLFFNPKSPSSIQKSISEILNSEIIRKKLSDSGFKYQKKFSWKKMAQEYYGIYKKVIDNRRKKRHN